MKPSFLQWAVGLLLISFSRFTSQAQVTQHDVLWMFGKSNVLNFSSGSPVPDLLPNFGGPPNYQMYFNGGAVCNSRGQLLFWAKFINSLNTSRAILFSRNGQPMPGSIIQTGATQFQIPHFLPKPGDTSLYYMFYTRQGSLYYSLIDLRLNGGMGDMVAAEKDVLLGTAGTVVDHKIVITEGCSGAWIVVRSHTENAYYSYHISAAGINPIAVKSICGQLPLTWYGDDGEYNGLLTSAVGGWKLASANATVHHVLSGDHTPKGGLELYDFDACTGTVSNAVMLDTGFYFGVCFSPDNGKLYATKMLEGTVYQFDLSAGSIASMRASKTKVLTSYGGIAGNTIPEQIGDIKRGRDGRLYTGNNFEDRPLYANALHVISQPNQPGMTCLPIPNGYPLAANTNASATGFTLPAPIITGKIPDTLSDPVRSITACFRDTFLLEANVPGHCFLWADGAQTANRFVTMPGDYALDYYDNNCTLHHAVYRVSFMRLHPKLTGSYACPGAGTGTAVVSVSNTDTALFTYSWSDAGSRLLREVTTRHGDTLHGLDTGSYKLHISNLTGCDTALFVYVQPMPKPVAASIVTSTVCVGVPVTFTSTSAAPLSRWVFGYGDVVQGRVTNRAFPIAGDYRVLLVVQNAEGCTDTLEHKVAVLGLHLELTADRTTVPLGGLVNLQVRAQELFRTIAWTPAALFSQPGFVDQRIQIDSTTLFKVTGISDFGCVDSAEIKVFVDPAVFMPSAFSPNNDGRNDRFRLHSSGDGIFIRHLAVYNRWGQQVWEAYGYAAAEGWDGTAFGKACDVGVYFYTADIETRGGKVLHRQGDVSLVR